MERDLSNKKIYQEEEMPESGAGSEFNRKLREEARRKKYGIVLKEFKAEDQPWILKVNGKAGRKWVVGAVRHMGAVIATLSQEVNLSSFVQWAMEQLTAQIL